VATKEIMTYYDSTAARSVRADLKYAVELVDNPGIAIDCGCGAGADIAFLRDKGFTVHAFDIEEEAVARCRRRFSEDDQVVVSQASFTSFVYPDANLISADASLFFCPEQEFDDAWSNITRSLSLGGVFSGSFLGERDTTAGPDYDREAYWSDVLVVTEHQLRKQFETFEIKRWTEHEFSGETAEGKAHHWHIFSVVARKC
jgi:SAM-dependent methyltransferase